MYVEMIDDVMAKFHSNPNKGRRWTLTQPFRMRVDGLDIVAPEGFWTDFASVPAFLWPIIDPYELGRAPVLHDFLYFAGWRSDRAYCDAAFMAGMEVDGIPFWKRNAAYRAVRMFGRGAWNNYRINNTKHRLARSQYAYRIKEWSDRDREVSA